jgi:hypothetical protein
MLVAPTPAVATAAATATAGAFSIGLVVVQERMGSNDPRFFFQLLVDLPSPAAAHYIYGRKPWK